MDLDSPGFHLLSIKRFRSLQKKKPFEAERMSIIAFLRDLKREKTYRSILVDGINDFLANYSPEDIQRAKRFLNNALDDLIASNASIVFIVKGRIGGMPDRPSIAGKPLALLFPRPPDLASMRPGYLYYPFM